MNVICQSRTSRRKGGDVTWGHDWQRQLVCCIYKCQRCESETELAACKQWIHDYIELNPELSKYLKRQLHQFFTRKFQEEKHWVHMYRIAMRHLNIKSSSRIEGEFGAVWSLKLHANTTLRLAFEKLRWAAQRRRRRKLSEVEGSFSRWLKRKSAVVTDDEDWQFLVKHVTSFYRKKIESVVAQVTKYKNQLVEAAVNELVFAVWRVDYDDDNSEPDDEHDCEEYDSDSDKDVDDEVELGPDAVAAPNTSEVNNVRANTSGRQWSQMTSFRWRRVRRVKLVYCPGENKYEVFCSCQRCEATCLPCVHQLNVMEIFSGVRLRDLHWHPRVTNAHYYSALVREDEWHTNATSRIHPHVAQVFVDEWRAGNDKFASSIGVPQEGELGNNFQVTEHHTDTNADDQDNDAPNKESRKSGRVPAYNSAYSQRMHHAIHGALPHSSRHWTEYCLFQKTFFEKIQRRCNTSTGVGPSARKLGVADAAQGRGKKRQRSEAKGNCDPVLELRERIRKNGLASGSYVQIENRENEKWFMRIDKGNVIDADGDDPSLESALWCKPNSVSELDPAYRAQKCEIKTIMDAGSYTKFKRMLEGK